MKKAFIYIIIILAVIAVLVLVGSSSTPARKFDERITLKQHDKNPYGFYVAKQLLPQLFPNAAIYADNNPPILWDSVFTKNNQAIFLVSAEFRPSADELESLYEFARSGNHLFIIANTLSKDADDFFSLVTTLTRESLYKDSLNVILQPPVFKKESFVYPGKLFDGYVQHADSSQMRVLAESPLNRAQFIQFKAGEGNIYLHLAPLSFSNYFLLHKQNIHYYEKVLSVIPADVENILWSEYYLQKNDKPKESNWLGVLMRFPAFRAALITALALILLYVLLEMRRRYRYMPLIAKPGNDVLDFIQTVGRLYYDKRDHHDLAGKMASYFRDHIRTNYNISTEYLDAEFVDALHGKSGYEKDKINNIIASMMLLERESAISAKQLSEFYNQLNDFYKNT